MSDKELETIRQKRLKELQQKILLKEKQIEAKIDPNTVLSKLFRGRALEVFNASASQFPKETDKIRKLLVKLALDGKISEITGEQLFALLRQVGLPVKLNTSINYYGKGKTKTLSEKFKESMK
jgi:DNA-binding TFAR19-related protein (PDSD5 family)